KGIAEVQAAGRPIAAAEMVLVRIAYAADLPTPDEAIRTLDDGGSTRPPGNGSAAASTVSMPPQAQRFDAPPGGGPRAPAAPSVRAIDRMPQPVAATEQTPAVAVSSFPELVALATSKRDLQMKTALERDMRLVHCEDGKLEIALEPGAARSLVNDLSRKL